MKVHTLHILVQWSCGPRICPSECPSCPFSNSLLTTILHLSLSHLLSYRTKSHFFPSSATALARYNAAIGARLEAWQGFSSVVSPMEKDLIIAITTKAGAGAFHIPNSCLSDAMTGCLLREFRLEEAMNSSRCVKMAATYLGYCRNQINMP